MEKRFILRGLLAGGIAGALAFAFARIFAEPVIQQAINYESGRDDVQNALDKAKGLAVAPDVDIFSRSIQRNIGIGVGMIFFGIAVGGLFAVAYIITARHTPTLRPRTRAVLIAAATFVSFYLVPFLKYPANPPAIGHPETIKTRSMLYLIMVVVGVAGMIIAVIIGHRLSASLGNWNATLVAGAGYLVLVGIAIAVLPDLGHLSSNVTEYGRYASETPQPLRDAKGAILYPGFPADVLWKFRWYSLVAQLIMWGSLGLIAAPLYERVHAAAAERSAPAATELVHAL